MALIISFVPLSFLFFLFLRSAGAVCDGRIFGVVSTREAAPSFPPNKVFAIFLPAPSNKPSPQYLLELVSGVMLCLLALLETFCEFVCAQVRMKCMLVYVQTGKSIIDLRTYTQHHTHRCFIFHKFATFVT